MNSRWVTLISASLVAFASLVIAWQVRHYDDTENLFSSIAQSFIRGKQQAAISNISARDNALISASGISRNLDLVLPKDARIFLPDMTGPANYNKVGDYFFITYYLFPREIGVSLDQPTRITNNGFLGRPANSDQEVFASRFNVILIVKTNGPQCIVRDDLQVQKVVEPVWFDSYSDLVIAFLLPLLTALAGMWLFRLLFPALSVEMPLLEQLACGLGLGMMAVAALTLGVKLCGFSGQRLILAVTAMGGIAEMWCHRKAFLTGISGGFQKLIRSPVAIAVLVAGLLVFLILFRLAGLQGLVDPDAMRWMLKG